MVRAQDLKMGIGLEWGCFQDASVLFSKHNAFPFSRFLSPRLNPTSRKYKASDTNESFRRVLPPPYKANSQATEWSVCRTSTRCHVAHSWARGLSVALSLGFWLDPNYLGVREKFPTASLEAEGTVVTSLAQASRVPGRTLGSLIPSPSKGELGGLVCEDWPV